MHSTKMYAISLAALFLMVIIPSSFGKADPLSLEIWDRIEALEKRDKEQSSEINTLKHQVKISNQKLEIISGLNEDLRNDLAAKTKKLAEQDGIIKALKKDVKLQKLEAESNSRKFEILALKVEKIAERSEETDQSFVHPETNTEELSDTDNDEEEETSETEFKSSPGNHNLVMNGTMDPASDMTEKLLHTSTGNTISPPDNGKPKKRHNGSIISKRFLTNGVPEGPVAFHAVVAGGHVEHLGINQNIVFDKVNLNLGGGYLDQHGIFTAPKSGLYIFSASILSYINAKSEIEAAIVKNGVILAYAYGHGDSGRDDQGSVTVVMQLNVGDVVSVQNKDIADASLWGQKYTSFTGILVAEM